RRIGHLVGEGSTETPQGVGRGQAGHVPVLLKEAIDFLAVRRGGTYIDATVGLGGHSLEIAKRIGAPGHLIGFDKDPKALEIARKVVSRGSLAVGEEPVVGRWPLVIGQNQQTDWPTIELRNGSFAELANDERRTTRDGVDGIL